MQETKRWPAENFFDQFGLIGSYEPPGSQDAKGQKVGPKGFIDCGDSTQRIGMYYFGLRVAKHLGMDISKYHNTGAGRFKLLSNLLFCRKNKAWKRGLDSNYWYYDCDRGSRDQTMPMLMGLSENGFSIRQHFWGHARRLWLFATNTRRNGAYAEVHGTTPHRNPPKLTVWHRLVLALRIPVFEVPKGWTNYNWRFPDVTGPSVWAVYMRHFAKRSPVLQVLFYLPLCILDLEFLVNSIIKRTVLKDDTDVVNHVIEGIYFARNTPTPTVWFANKYINSSADLDAKCRKYFDYDKNYGRMPWFIYELYALLIPKYFKAK